MWLNFTCISVEPLTQMHNAGIPLRHIQEISGHNDLGTLQRYLEVSPEQRKKAVSVIGW